MAMTVSSSQRSSRSLCRPWKSSTVAVEDRRDAGERHAVARAAGAGRSGAAAEKPRCARRHRGGSRGRTCRSGAPRSASMRATSCSSVNAVCGITNERRDEVDPRRRREWDALYRSLPVDLQLVCRRAHGSSIASSRKPSTSAPMSTSERAQPDPQQHDDDRRERPIGLAVAREVRGVEREARRDDQPTERRDDRSAGDEAEPPADAVLDGDAVEQPDPGRSSPPRGAATAGCRSITLPAVPRPALSSKGGTAAITKITIPRNTIAPSVSSQRLSPLRHERPKVRRCSCATWIR